MKYPIVRVKTVDDVELQGMRLGEEVASSAHGLVIHLHGIWGNFYENPFIDYFAEFYPRLGFVFLSANTRFHDGGSLTGRFETCLADIQAWLDYAATSGYNSVILQGHSLGTMQAVYYMTSTQPTRLIKGLILLAPVDHMTLYCTDNALIREHRITQAKRLAAQDPDALVPKSFFDLWPLSASTYLNLTDDVTNADVFPFRRGTLSETRLSYIRLPVFTAVGGDDFAAFPSADAQIQQLTQLPGVVATLIEGAPHNFAGYEQILLYRIEEWLSRVEF